MALSPASEAKIGVRAGSEWTVNRGIAHCPAAEPTLRSNALAKAEVMTALNLMTPLPSSS
jgi:hypothetical protein